MEVTDNERAVALRAALDKLNHVYDAHIEGDSESPDVVITMLGHKTAVPREIRELADALDFDKPGVGRQSGEDYEYGKGLSGQPERLWTRMRFTQE